MTMNKYVPHVYVIPEDDANRQIANGFVLHHRVDSRRIQVMPEAGGWNNVLRTFRAEYVNILQSWPKAHVAMLIDFDGRSDLRRAEFEQATPDALRARVFVVGSKQNPEVLKKALGKHCEQIGESLADDCDSGTKTLWGHEELNHNNADLQRMVQTVKPFLFYGNSHSLA